MKIEELLGTHNFERSLLIGYYGGGNYGDELLLEVFENLLARSGVHALAIAHLDPANYKTFHHDFGYQLIRTGDKKQLIRAIWKNKNIVVGGGGLWGLDVNMNTLLLSVTLFLSKRLLRKRVYLLGVGYYDSTPGLGRISAWLAGKAADYIIARDTETLHNFKKLSKRTALGKDAAWHVPELNLRPYRADLAKLEKDVRVNGKTLFITLRRFKPSQKNSYTRLVEQCIRNNEGRNIIVALMEPKTVDPAGFRLIRTWAKRYKHVQAIDFSYNPLAFFLFFKKHRRRLVLIGPQFHIIMTAHLAGVPYMPIAYDNKVVELLKQTGHKNILALPALAQADLATFANNFYRGTP